MAVYRSVHRERNTAVRPAPHPTSSTRLPTISSRYLTKMRTSGMCRFDCTYVPVSFFRSYVPLLMTSYVTLRLSRGMPAAPRGWIRRSRAR